jgi:hypothetical protein
LNLESLPGQAGLLALECRIADTHRVGDHYLVLAQVEQMSIYDGSPLLYWRRGLHRFKPEYPFVASRRSFDNFVAAWETAVLPRAEWTHGAHIAIAASYAVSHGRAAFQQIKEGILRYNVACGIPQTDTSGCHETLTRFWAEIVFRVISPFADPWMAARHAVQRLGEERDLHRLYYSFDVVRCAEARRSWIPPDLEGPY